MKFLFLILSALSSIASAENITFGTIISPVNYNALATSIKNTQYVQEVKVEAAAYAASKLHYKTAENDSIEFSTRKNNIPDTKTALSQRYENPILATLCILDQGNTFTTSQNLKVFGYRYIVLKRNEQSSATNGIFEIFATDDLNACNKINLSTDFNVSPVNFGYSKIGDLKMQIVLPPETVKNNNF